MSAEKIARIGILLSGRGSNFLALHAAMESGVVPARISLVTSNRKEAPGILKAMELGLPTAVVPHRDAPSREAHEERILELLRAARVEWLCLAGYLRLLTPGFVSAYPTRILNIHPSLLPAFPGLEAQRQALEHGVRISGCTVHFVDGALDCGPIVAQRAVPAHADDTPETLAARILLEEHQAYPEALRRLLTEPWQIEGRCVHFLLPRAQAGGEDREDKA